MTGGVPQSWRQLELDPRALVRTALYEARSGRAYRDSRPIAAATLLTTAGMHYALVEPQAALDVLEEASQIYLETSRPFGALVAASTGRRAAITIAAQSETVRSVISRIREDATYGSSDFSEPSSALQRDPDTSEQFARVAQPSNEDVAAALALEFSVQTLIDDQQSHADTSESLVDAIDLDDSDGDFLWSGLFSLRDIARIVTSDGQMVQTAKSLLERSAHAIGEAMRDEFHWRSLTGWPPLSPETLWLGQLLLQGGPEIYEQVSGLARIPIEVAASFRE